MARGLSDLIKQAQKLQKRMMEIQEELANKTVEATVGGGMVTVVANGQQEILSIKISPEVVDPEDVEMLVDLIIAAVQEAQKKAQALAEEKLGPMADGLRGLGLST